MVFDSQTKTISLILQGQRGTQTFLMPNSGYLRAQTQAGVLAIDDAEVATPQFLDACQSTLFKPVLFNFAEAPALERIEHVVGIAVKTFFAAYRTR